jgi:hypothetical protein
MIHPSSPMRVEFETEAQAAYASSSGADQDRHWMTAYRRFNGLAMFEMLPALAGLPKDVRDQFWAQRNRFATPGEIPRMEYAVNVVVNGEVPEVAPGDLVATNQEKWAMEFLNDDNPPTRVPFARTMLTYAGLLSQYPLGTKDDVKQLIGGGVNVDWIQNTCAIRMSRALNYSGFTIPSNQTGLFVVTGDDKKSYSLRMRELAKFLEGRIGAPSLVLAAQPIRRKRLGEMKGIISFDIHFTDATGHIDLWDGKTFTHEPEAGKDYFSLATKVSFWRLH